MGIRRARMRTVAEIEQAAAELDLLCVVEADTGGERLLLANLVQRSKGNHSIAVVALRDKLSVGDVVSVS